MSLRDYDRLTPRERRELQKKAATAEQSTPDAAGVSSKIGRLIWECPACGHNWVGGPGT